MRVFDPGGQYLRTVIRRGEGPGEVLDANGIFLYQDTLLWVHDTRQWTVIGVNPTGEEVRRFAKPVMSYGFIWDGTFDWQGRYWKETSHSVGEREYPPPMGLSQVTDRHYYKSYDLSSGAIDSVYVGEVSFRSYAYSTPTILWGFLDLPFDASEISAVNPSGGLWRANSAAYSIARTNEGGDTVVVIEAGLPVQSVTARDRSAYVERYTEIRPELRREAEEVAALMPDLKPILADIFVDDEGRLWVQRVTPADTPAFYDRYSEDGDYLGSVRLGFKAAGPLWVQHGNIYTWVTDELGVGFVVRAPLS